MCIFRSITLIALICGLFASCGGDIQKSSEDEGKTNIIEVPELKPDSKRVKITDIFEISDRIKLETNPQLIISGEVLSNIHEHKNRIYLLDMNLKPGFNSGVGDIYSFDKNGKFLHKIGRKGKGPEEYINVHDFEIWDDIVYMVDENLGKIVSYSLSGDFINVIKPDFRFYGFAILDTKSYFFWLNNFNKQVTSKDNEIIMCDSKFENVEGILKEDNKTGAGAPTSFIVFDTLLYFNRYNSNTIHAIDKNGNSHEAYKLDYRPENVIPEEILKDDVFAIEAQRKEKNFAKIFRYYILKDYVYFELVAKERYILLFSKNTEAIKLINTKNITNNFDETGNSIRIRGSVYESNTLIGYVCAHNIIDNAKNPDTKITSLSEKINEEDNPVIVYYNIVDF